MSTEAGKVILFPYSYYMKGYSISFRESSKIYFQTLVDSLERRVIFRI